MRIVVALAACGVVLAGCATPRTPAAPSSQAAGQQAAPSPTDRRCADPQLNDKQVTFQSQGVYLAGRFPVSIYPGWLRFGVTFLVPLAFAITVPAEAVTSRLEWSTVGLSVGFAVALFAFTRWWWGFGLRSYSGASA